MLPAAGKAAPPPPPWMNTALPPDARADLLLSQMTQDEQLQMVQGYFGAELHLAFIKPIPKQYRAMMPGTSGFIPGIARLGIPTLIETDAGIGVANNIRMRPNDRTTALPSGIAEAATWNPDIAYAAGAVIGAEARDRGYNVVLDGAVNLVRDPRGGRTFEYAGEDPLLAGTVVGEMVRGVQSRHLISTVKHFALNDQETGRYSLNAIIDEGPFRESDLLAFELAIERGEPGSVMCAYNRVNGPFACESDFLLNGVLKRDWKFPGFVMSDWGAVHSTAASVNAGLDQESASGFDTKEFFAGPLKDALAAGTVTPARLRDMVHRILREMFAKGIMDNPPAKRTSDYAAHLAVAERAAEQAIVLLKNEGGILPLARDAKSIAVIGAHADIGMLSGGGSSQVLGIGHNRADEFPIGGGVIVLPNGAKIPPLNIYIYEPPSPLSAIRAMAPRARVRFDDGEDVQSAVALAQSCDVAVVFAQQWMTEGQDVPDLSLQGAQDALIAAVAAANPHTIVVLETGGPVLMPWLDRVPAVLEAWYGGTGGAGALARILFGAANPSGKLPVTFPQDVSQLPRPQIPGITLPGRAPFDLAYSEGALVGYKWFAAKNLTPLFPFGFGLSYSTFHLDRLQATGGATLTVSLDLTNDGQREGMETAQVYATPPGDGAAERLIGWSKVDLMPGETRRVTIAADPRLLAQFDAVKQVWRVAAGTYRIAAGTSSGALTATAQADVTASEIAP